MRFVWLSALATALGLLAAPLAAGAQPPASRIGFVMSNTLAAISDRDRLHVPLDLIELCECNPRARSKAVRAVS